MSRSRPTKERPVQELAGYRTPCPRELRFHQWVMVWLRTSLKQCKSAQMYRILPQQPYRFDKFATPKLHAFRQMPWLSRLVSLPIGSYMEPGIWQTPRGGVPVSIQQHEWPDNGHQPVRMGLELRPRPAQVGEQEVNSYILRNAGVTQ